MQAGCATKLNFDSVSAAWGAEAGAEVPDASSSESDAGEADGGVLREAGTKEDAGGPTLGATQGAAGIDAGPETRSDAGAADAGQSQSDAASASASDAAADPSAFACSKLTPTPTFCDDFESSSPLSQWGFTNIDPAPLAGRIAVDNRSARTGRGALLAVVNPAVATCAQCYLSVSVQTVLPELKGRVRLKIEFDMRVESIDTQLGHRSAVFHFFLGNVARGFSEHTLELKSSGDSLQAEFVEYDRDGEESGDPLVPDPPPVSHDLVQGPPLYEWVHVKYVLDLEDANGSGNSVSLTLDDTQVANHLLYFGLRYHQPTLALGVPLVDRTRFLQGETNEGWEVRFDNVVAQIEPR
ncbi:MAG TPA: hypothetical protein VFZ61_33500 [Polyangiales bacterium]